MSGIVRMRSFPVSAVSLTVTLRRSQRLKAGTATALLTLDLIIAAAITDRPWRKDQRCRPPPPSRSHVSRLRANSDHTEAGELPPNTSIDRTPDRAPASSAAIALDFQMPIK